MRTHIGQYRIEAPLGRGGMGVVYRGFHENLGRQVAIKALAPELTQQPEFKERFFVEAKTQARLQHPNIVGVYDLLEEGGEFFIVMELVTGEGLDDRLKAIAGRGMDLHEAVGVFSQVLAALDYAHSEGVIHRDIKPSNVMITAGGRVKLTDFGIALLIGDKRLTASQSSIGTPTYMSPEQIIRPRSVDHRTDLYSAAVVFYEMLAGKPPFDDETEYGIKKLHVEAPLPDISELRPGLPAGVVQALSTALAKNPDDRFASGGMFLRALQEAVPQAIPQGATPLPAPAYRPTTVDSAWTGSGAAASGPATAPPPVPPASGGRSMASELLQGKNRWVALTAAAVLVLGLGFGIVVLLLSSGRDKETVADATEAALPLPETAPAGTSVPAPVSTQVPVQAVPLAETPGTPRPVPLGAPAVQPQPPRPAAQPVTPPAPKPTRRKASEAAPPPAEPSAPPAAPEPVRTAPAPEPQEAQPATQATAGIDQFQEMEDLVVSVAKLSEQAFESYEQEGREDDLFELLDSFHEAAAEMRKEFRRTTGTGVRGTLSKFRGRGGQGDTRALEIKVQDLSRRAAEIDRLISSGSPTTQDYWREVRSNLRRLSGHF